MSLRHTKVSDDHGLVPSGHTGRAVPSVHVDWTTGLNDQSRRAADRIRRQEDELE